MGLTTLLHAIQLHADQSAEDELDDDDESLDFLLLFLSLLLPVLVRRLFECFSVGAVD